MDALTQARELIEAFLAASMKPDPVLARHGLAEDGMAFVPAATNAFKMAASA